MEDVEEGMIDFAVFADSAGEGYIDNLIVVNSYHHIAKTFLQRLDAGTTHAAGDDAVVSSWVTSSLEVTEDGYADIKVRIFLLRTIGIMESATSCFAGSNKYNATRFCLAETILYELFKLILFNLF